MGGKSTRNEGDIAVVVEVKQFQGGDVVSSVLGAVGRKDQADPVVVPLDDPRAVAPELAGAKAAALAVAARAGLPVLPGIVVTTAATRPLGDELRAAWSEVSHAGELSLVVRSSSTAEDGSNSSMAGLFTSVLDVCGWDDFRAAIETVLASSNVVALSSGPSPSGSQPMAVLVQRYLRATVGGVLFGVDPVTGRRDRMVVSATDRGPSALVSGEVDGTRYVLDRRGRSRGAADGAPVLDRGRLRRLARMARTAERTFGGPQDIEWAFDGDGRLWLLQSRPVTATGDSARATGPVLGPGPVAETFPDPLSPLEEDLWAPPLRAALRSALALAGTVPSNRLAASPVLAGVDGRLAVDLDLMAAREPAPSLLRRLDPRPPVRRLVAAWRVGRLRAALPALAGDLVARADADLLSLDALDTLSDNALLALLDDAGQALTALHGHEVLMGWLVDASTSSATAASVGLQALAAGRATGMADDEILARSPAVLALVPPRISPSVVLPPTYGDVPPAPEATDRAATLREALRLRARWVHELTARAAWELGGRLVARDLIGDVEQVRFLRREELTAAVRQGRMPADLAGRRHRPASAPLPARFRLTPEGRVVQVQSTTGSGSGSGAGGGRGMGVVDGGSGAPDLGAVLVVRTLDPALAPLLPRLGGLVAETGSMLSHLAILAREMNVPTAVGVGGAVDRFPPGTLVMVDGTTGEVAVVDEQPVQGPSGPLSGREDPSGPLSGRQGAGGPQSGKVA